MPTKRASSFPTPAGDSEASTRAKLPSRLRGWPERPASRFRSAGLGRKSSPGPTFGQRRRSRRGRASTGRRSSPGTSLLTTQVRRQSRRPTPCRMFARSTFRAIRPCARVPTGALGRPETTSPARSSWTNLPALLAWTRSSFGLRTSTTSGYQLSCGRQRTNSLGRRASRWDGIADRVSPLASRRARTSLSVHRFASREEASR